MINVLAIVNKVSTPMDEPLIDMFIGIYDATALDADAIVRQLYAADQLLVGKLRRLSQTLEDDERLDDYLAAKRKALATWMRRYRRSRHHYRRRLRARARCEFIPPCPPWVADYWRDPMRCLWELYLKCNSTSSTS